MASDKIAAGWRTDAYIPANFHGDTSMIRTGAQYLAFIRGGRGLAAVYRSFDWDGPLDCVRKAADLAPRGELGTVRASRNTAIAATFRRKGR